METKLLFPILIFLAYLAYCKPSQMQPARDIIYISAPIKKPAEQKVQEPYLPMAVSRSGWESLFANLNGKGDCL